MRAMGQKTCIILDDDTEGLQTDIEGAAGGAQEGGRTMLLDTGGKEPTQVAEDNETRGLLSGTCTLERKPQCWTALF